MSGKDLRAVRSRCGLAGVRTQRLLDPLRKAGIVVVGPSDTRCLLALLALAAGGKTPTAAKSVAARLRVCEQAAFQALGRLRDLGLVTWERGRYRTIRPAVRLVPIGR